VIYNKTRTFGVAGFAGLASLGMFFGSHYLVGLAGMEELILLAAGVVLIALEMFVIPGFGIAGIAGIAAILGSVFLSLVSGVAGGAEIMQAAGVMAVAGIVVVVLGWAFFRNLPRSGRFSKSGLMLADATSRETGYLSAAVRSELIGATGVAVTDLRPSGTVKIGKERIDVVADSSWITAGTPVRVVKSDGYRHVVEPAD
jgi:membrane-bound serine protease (ClpP class)